MDQRREQKLLKEFGQTLNNIRLSKKISLRKLADLADIDYSNLSEIQTGKVAPTLLTLIKLAEALGIHPGEFFGK